MQLEAGVCGCRVGFNGERIHFGAGGCRCVGGNNNRGLVDLSVGNALENTFIFVREIIEDSPEDVCNLVCIVCKGVQNIVRVSLGVSIVSLAYLAVKSIEMCSLLSRILHALDKCPALSCIAVGVIAEYFGEENRASIASGIVFLKYPFQTIYILCLVVYFTCVILKRLLTQWPLALVKSLTSFVRSGGHAEDGQIAEDSESGQVVIVLKSPSLDDGVMSWLKNRFCTAKKKVEASQHKKCSVPENRDASILYGRHRAKSK